MDPEPQPPEGAQSNEQPDLEPLEEPSDGDDVGDADGDSGGSGVSLPSLSSRQLLILGAIVAAIAVVAYLSQRDGSVGDSIEDVREADLESDEVVVEEGDTIRVEQDGETLDADESVIRELQERGTLSGGD